MLKLILFTLSTIFIFSGCMSGKVNYTTPLEPQKLVNKITINKDKETVWKSIVSKLGSSFFVINNMEKDSGFINLSYSGNPQHYVDCGKISSFVKNARGDRFYNFPASIETQNYEIIENGRYFQVYRVMNLEGRINIILQEISKNKTSLMINIKYILTKKSTVKTPINVNQMSTEKYSDTITFNTNGYATFPASTTKCYANGSLEREIINLLRD